MRFTILLLSTALLLPAEQPNVSDSINKELPSWVHLDFSQQFRAEGYSALGFDSNQADYYAMERVRMNLVLKPTNWLRFDFQGQDARGFWKDDQNGLATMINPATLRMGYVTIGDAEHGHVAFLVGRQELNYGDQRLVGSSNWTNTGRVFDAVRVRFHTFGWQTDVFAASVVKNEMGHSWNHHQPGNDLHGINTTNAKLIKNGTVEAYVFWRVQNTIGLDQKTTGFRLVGTLPHHWDYNSETAIQRGSRTGQDLPAWATHQTMGYRLVDVKWTPRISGEYNYASPLFDTLYPTAHNKYGLVDQFGWRNIHNARAGVDFLPWRNFSVVTNFHEHWLVDPKLGAFNLSGGLAVANPGGAVTARHLDHEVDVQFVWNINKTVTLNAGVGHLFPSEFLKQTTRGSSLTYPIVNLAYTF